MTRRVQNRLTAVAVQNLKTPGKHADGGGLVLIVDESGHKRWSFIYTRGSKRCELGLGSARDVTLAMARAQAAEYRETLADGKDPKATKHVSSTTVTFGEYADQYVATMRSSWRNAKHADQWVMTLQKYAAPLRKKPIREITTEDIVRVLKARWTTTPETADRLRGRIENVLDSAKAMGFREGDNPARWRGHLDQILPKRRALSRGHHAALPFGLVPDFIRELKQRPGVAARALEFAILTAARTSEVLGSRWEEFDSDFEVWTVPTDRMKALREHRVPLSRQAVEILRAIKPRELTGYVFPNAGGNKPLSIMAMPMLLRRMNETITVHGFRSSFRDWAAEMTNFSNEVCEMALAHAIASKTEAAYRRGDLFLKRRRLMEQWARFCHGEQETYELNGRAKSLRLVQLTGPERVALLDLLANARCSLCGSGWGEQCRTQDDRSLEWSQSHDRRFMRLVEDWALASDDDLTEAIASADGSSSAKAAVVKLELARRALNPASWVHFASDTRAKG